ncbi:MAG: extracellular solute-binding protein [Gammaproteobacteria bacterium]|nr:extracellular solute-binding protein [Gammaproteobacteria bacterium]
MREHLNTTKVLISILILIWCALAYAQDDQKIYKSHAIAMHGEPKYGADFKHVDYVNPDAPKGGTLRTGAQGTFDSFHPYISKGNPVSTGSIETLLTSSADEPFTEYGLIAETIEWPEDRSWVIFNLRDNARWHDGQAITADDVVWSFKKLIEKGSPQYRFYYASVGNVEKLGDRRVKFNFNEKGNRELPLIMGQLPILPKHYWETRDFEKTTLEQPLGSGPYRIETFEAGRFIVQKRVDDYWGRDLPINIGLNNIELIRTSFFRDDTAIRLALKSGDIDFREENQAKAWALDYDVPAVRKQWLKKELVTHQRPTGMQAFVMNTRREVFKDQKVRQALAYAFDFEWTNKNLFFGLYTRTQSYFSNSELAATDVPMGEELEILERYRGRISDWIFQRPYIAPATDGSGWLRENLRKAFPLLEEAGWVVNDMKLENTDGVQMQFEILLVSPAFERIVLPFIRNLKRLGIDARIRLVDQTQYINRIRSFDFDMLISGWGQSDSPGNEQRNYWSSTSANNPSSRNFIGISNPVIDELIELVITADSRESLVARTRALDRVLLSGFYVIPNWHIRADRVLYWDKFSRPEIKTKNGVMTDRWWYDEAKVASLNIAMETDESLTEEVVAKDPSYGRYVIVFIALLFVGWLALRRAMRPRGT